VSLGCKVAVGASSGNATASRAGNTEAAATRSAAARGAGAGGMVAAMYLPIVDMITAVQ
jgi:hypothetical protein